MFKVKRNILIFLCFIACGCSNDKFVYTSYWVEGGGGGIINDSLALFGLCGTNHYSQTATIAGGGDWSELGDCRLTLADIRTEKMYWQKEIPISGRNLDLKFNAMLDSVLFFIKESGLGNLKQVSKIATLKLEGERFQQAGRLELKGKEIKLIGEGWEYLSEVRVRPWRDGLILANSRYWDGDRNLNHYALLDTVSGTMELWLPSGEVEWLNECADAKWSSVGGLCLKEVQDSLGFVLLKNGADTLAIRYMPYKLSVSSGAGNRGKPLIFSGNSIISGGWVYLANEYGHVSENPLDIWVYHMGIFNDLYGNEVDYCKKVYH